MLCCVAGKVFQAAQAHWLSACLHVMLELRVADVLMRHTDSAAPPAGPSPGAAAADKTGSDAQQGMHVDEVRLTGLVAPGASKLEADKAGFITQLNRIHGL